MILAFGFFLLHVTLLANDAIPSACRQFSCEADLTEDMSWEKTSQALQLTHKQSICYPDREAVSFVDDDLVWSLQANHWHIRTRVGQASHLHGDLSFVSDHQILSSNQAWIWRSADGGLDKICLPRRAKWTHQSWQMNISNVLYQADSDQIYACDNAFVMYGKNNQPLYGYAKQLSTMGKQLLIMKSVHATTCPIEDRSWSLSADQLEWHTEKKRATVKNAKLYIYDVPVFRWSNMTFELGANDRYGWLLPKFYSYYGDTLLISFPYRFRTQNEQVVAPWMGSGRSVGLTYFTQGQARGLRYRSLLRVGEYKNTPNFRYGGIVQGEKNNIFGKDSTYFQFLNVRDGWFGQYFSPVFIPRIRPNQDLPSYLTYQSRGRWLSTDFSLRYYQKFSGEKVLQDEIGIPFLHELPRLNMTYVKNGIEISGLAEHLVADSDKDNYPGVTRALGYLGYTLKKGKDFWVNLGSWMKSQAVDTYSGWTGYSTQHAFVVPNVEIDYRYRFRDTLGISLAYAYTPFVDQSKDPVFQRRWLWMGDRADFDKLKSVDRVYDRNRVWLGMYRYSLPNFPTAYISATHIFDLKTPLVSLSQTGSEDPLTQYPNEVTVFQLRDKMYNFSSEMVWIWPLSSAYRYDLRWNYDRFSLKWRRFSDYVVFQNQQVRVPMYRETGGEVDLFQTDFSRLYMGIDYKSGLDRYLKYHLGWMMDRCCWQGKAAVYLTRWMSKDASVQNVYTGWQPSVNVSFSIKGLSIAK